MQNRVVIIILFLNSTLAFTQGNDPLKELILKLDLFHKNYRQEKVHLHLDKSYYSIGDTIYFKAYVVNAEQNTLSGLSSLLYVDLIDEQNEIKKSILLLLDEGVAAGDIELTNVLEEGNYRIRAYSNWMCNFSEDYFFDKVICMGNALTGE